MLIMVIWRPVGGGLCPWPIPSPPTPHSARAHMLTTEQGSVHTPRVGGARNDTTPFHTLTLP